MTELFVFIFDLLRLWWNLMVSHTASSYVVLIIVLGFVALLVRNSISD